MNSVVHGGGGPATACRASHCAFLLTPPAAGDATATRGDLHLKHRCFRPKTLAPHAAHPQSPGCFTPSGIAARYYM
jgi:hypothetical protein